eukprot:9123685-Pyramimonas_sp.AAC.1
MSHPVHALPEQNEHEILIPLSSYPDSQRKDGLSAETRDSVDAGPLDTKEDLPVVLRDSVAAGESYDKTNIVPNISRSADGRVVQHDGHDADRDGPIQDQIPPSYIATRVVRGRSIEGITEMSADVSPEGAPIGDREQTPDPHGRDG